MMPFVTRKRRSHEDSPIDFCGSAIGASSGVALGHLALFEVAHFGKTLILDADFVASY
jgi:hypothetical protein